MSEPRALPWSNEAEQAVLGAALLHPPALPIVRPTLTAGDFYHPAHGAIFAGMLEVVDGSSPLDSLTLGDHLRTSGQLHKLKALGGEAYFAELTSAVVTVENVAHYAGIVAKTARVRRLMAAAQEIAAKGFGDYGDADEFLQASATRIASIANGHRGGTLSRPIDSVLREVIAETGEACERLAAGRPANVIPTGFRDVDDVIIGWEPGTMAILASPPSVGKTALMMDFIDAASINGFPCYVGTREMRDTDLIRRRLASRSGVDHSRIRRGDLTAMEWARISGAAGELAAQPIEISRAFTSVLDFEAGVRLWRASKTDQSRPALAAVDYLQLLSPPPAHGRRERNREQEVREMSNRLKALAIELGIALLVLSQLNRAGAEGEPSMRHLRDSGAIEQDADIIAFIIRKGRNAKLKIDKQRNGPVDKIPLLFDAEHVRFLDAGAEARLPPAPPDHVLDEDEEVA